MLFFIFEGSNENEQTPYIHLCCILYSLFEPNFAREGKQTTKKKTEKGGEQREGQAGLRGQLVG